MSTERLLAAAALGCFAACVEASFVVDPATQLTCASDDECPDGRICVALTSRCVPPEDTTGTPRGLAGVVIDPAAGTIDTPFDVTLTALDPLFGEPAVTLVAGDALTLIASEPGRRAYRYLYTATGREPEGTVGLTAELLDIGGRLGSFSAGSITFDFTRPRVELASASSPRLVVLTLSEAVRSEGLTEPTDYAFTPPASLVAVSLAADGRSIRLQLDRDLSTGQLYTVSTLPPIVDVAGNARDQLDAAPSFVGPARLVDTTPPLALYPAGGERVIGLSQTLAWSAKPEAVSYEVELAFDTAADDANDFATSAVPGSPFTIDSGDTELQLVLPDAVSFLWRVRADTTASGAYGVGRFEAVDQALYVWCPDSASTCTDDTLSAGNKTHPFRTIDRALAMARILGLNRINVAGRGGTAVYREPVVLRDGIDVYGGWSSDFATRDPASTPAVIDVGGGRAPGALLVNGLRQATVADGLSLRNSNQTCVRIAGSDAPVTITNIVVASCLAAVYVTDSNGPVVQNLAGMLPSLGNDHLSGLYAEFSDVSFDGVDLGAGAPSNGAQTPLVRLDDSVVTIRNSTLAIDEPTGTAAVVGLRARRSSVTLDATSISIASPNGNVPRGVWLLDSDATLTGVDVTLGPRPGTPQIGLSVNGGGDVIVRDSTITVGAGSNTQGIYLFEATGSLLVERSTLSAGAATATGAALQSTSSVAWSGAGPVVTVRHSTLETASGGTSSIVRGAWLADCRARLEYNDITAGGGGTSYGIYSDGVDARFEGNRVTSGDATAAASAGNSVGIFADTYDCHICTLEIVSNVVTGGSSATFDAFGIQIATFGYADTPARISNNTVSAGSSPASRKSAALHNGISGRGSYGPASIFTNNVFYTRGGTNRYGYYDVALPWPASFQNNLIFDTPTAYYAQYTTVLSNCDGATHRCWRNESELDVEGNTTGNGGLADGNRVLASFAASGLDGELRPTASSPDVLRYQGLDASQPLCGGGGVSSCGNVLRDADEVDRDCPTPGTSCYSRGAFEAP
jgi:hypothetical protein